MLALASRLSLAAVPCSQCLPCLTPPCYKDDGVFSYGTNGPGNTYPGGNSACWQQRANDARMQHAYPEKSGVKNEKCTCDEDWTEFESYSTGLDSLGREVMATREYYHRFCAPELQEAFTVFGREPTGGQSEMFACACQARREVRTQIPVHDVVDQSLLATASNLTAVANHSGGGGDGEARREGLRMLLSERFYVTLSNGTRVETDGPGQKVPPARARRRTAGRLHALSPRSAGLRSVALWQHAMEGAWSFMREEASSSDDFAVSHFVRLEDLTDATTAAPAIAAMAGAIGCPAAQNPFDCNDVTANVTAELLNLGNMGHHGTGKGDSDSESPEVVSIKASDGDVHLHKPQNSASSALLKAVEQIGARGLRTWGYVDDQLWSANREAPQY